jgi:hypothetical protein
MRASRASDENDENDRLSAAILPSQQRRALLTRADAHARAAAQLRAAVVPARTPHRIVAALDS